MIFRIFQPQDLRISSRADSRMPPSITRVPQQRGHPISLLDFSLVQGIYALITITGLYFKHSYRIRKPRGGVEGTTQLIVHNHCSSGVKAQGRFFQELNLYVKGEEEPMPDERATGRHRGGIPPPKKKSAFVLRADKLIYAENDQQFSFLKAATLFSNSARYFFASTTTAAGL